MNPPQEAPKATEVIQAWAVQRGLKPGSEVVEVLLAIMRQRSVPLWFAQVPPDADSADLSARIPPFPIASANYRVDDKQRKAMMTAADVLLPLAQALQAELGDAVAMRDELLGIHGADPEDARRFARNSAKDRRIRRASQVLVDLLDVSQEALAALLAPPHILPGDLIAAADARGRDMVAQEFAWRIDVRQAVEDLPNHELQRVIAEVAAGGTYPVAMTPRALKALALDTLMSEAARRNPGRPLDLELFIRRLLMLQRIPREWEPAVAVLFGWLYSDGERVCLGIARREFGAGGGDVDTEQVWEIVERSALLLLERVHLTCAATSEREFKGWLRVAARGKARGMRLQRQASLDALPSRGMALLAADAPDVSASAQGELLPASLRELFLSMALAIPGLVPQVPGLLADDEAAELQGWLRLPPDMAIGTAGQFLEALTSAAVQVLRERLPGRRVSKPALRRFLAALLASVTGGDVDDPLED